MGTIQDLPTGGPQLFARRSSGLVRAASTADASFVNLYVATFPIMVSFLLGIVLPFYGGANIYLTLVIGAVCAMPILIAYAVASSVMRRSGGDRVAPDGLSKVSAKTNSPYVAVIVVTVISAVISWFWAYTTTFTVVAGAFGQVITLGIGCLAASLIPFKQKDLYTTAPIRGYFGKVPRLTLIGILGAIGALLIVLNFARDPSSGVDPNHGPVMFWVSLGMFPLGFVLYYVSAAIRRRQGVNLDLAFREIPPE